MLDSDTVTAMSKACIDAESDTDKALEFLANKNIIMFGDPLQLPPVITNRNK